MITGDPRLTFVQLGKISTGIFKNLRFFLNRKGLIPMNEREAGATTPQAGYVVAQVSNLLYRRLPVGRPCVRVVDRRAASGLPSWRRASRPAVEPGFPLPAIAPRRRDGGSPAEKPPASGATLRFSDRLRQSTVGPGAQHVAQTVCLLYRRLAVGRPPAKPKSFGIGAPCGLETRDTADWKSALRHTRDWTMKYPGYAVNAPNRARISSSTSAALASVWAISSRSNFR